MNIISVNSPRSMVHSQIVNSPWSTVHRHYLLGLFLLLIPFMGFSQGQGPSPHQLDSSKVHFVKTAITDSLSGQTRYRCHIRLELPVPKAIRTIKIDVVRNNNNNQVRSARIPVNKGNFRRKRIGFMRRGNKVWLNFGTIPGNPNYTATIQLVDRRGRLTNAVVVQ